MDIKTEGNNITKKDVNVVINQIIDRLEVECHPKSIIMTGSFGRNEPSIILNKGKYKLLSDVEISIVPNIYVSNKKIAKIKSKYSKLLGVDITISKSIGLRILPFLHLLGIDRKLWKTTIQRYELKYGSRVVYGINYLKIIPDLNSKDIPLWEGIRLLFNRIAEALKHFSIDKSYTNYERQELLFWISKIIIGCQDTLLLSIGRYDSSYRIRNDLFKKYFSQYFSEFNNNSSNFLSLTIKANDYKLNPNDNIFKESISKLWFDTIEICEKVLVFAIKKDMGITFNTFVEFQREYLRNKKIRKEYYNELLSYPIYRNMVILPRSYRFLSLKLVKKFMIPWRHIIYSIIPLIYFSLSRNYNINENQLNQARNTLSLFKKLKSPNENLIKEWEYLKEQMLDLWYALCY